MNRPFAYGKRPSGWRSTQLREFLTRRRTIGRHDLPLLSVNLTHGVQLRDVGDGRPAPSEDLSLYQVVEIDDLVMNQLGKPHGSLGVSPYQGIISPAYFVAKIGPSAVPRFVHYLLRSRLYISEYERRGKWMPPSQFDISWEQFRSIQVELPPLSDQRIIADYLDSTTTQIDALIAKKRRMIGLLEERVDAQVSDYIRRSPLAGEGEVEVVPIRRVLTKLERWTNGGNMVTAFRDGEVTTREARNREGFTNAWTETTRVQQVEVGDVVIHGLDGFSGAIGDARMPGVCSPVYHVCIPKQGDSTFYGRMLRLLAIDGYLGNFAISTRERAVDFRNWDLFGRILVPLVPTDEQRAIGDEIRKIRPLRDQIVASESLALERRQALITAAVTGELKIPVRSVAV